MLSNKRLILPKISLDDRETREPIDFRDRQAVIEYRFVLGFPSYFTFTLFWCIGAFLIGSYWFVYALIHWIRMARGFRLGSSEDPDPDAKYEPLRLVLATLISPIFVLGSILMFVYSNAEAYQYRSIELGRVTGATVRKVDSESDIGSVPRNFEDSENLRAGLELLRRCDSEVFLNHESFKDGYRIQLMLDGTTSDFYISTYFETTASKHKSGVVAGSGSPFDCPQFENWVRQYIEPRFK
jgi:hypothetical protein